MKLINSWFSLISEKPWLGLLLIALATGIGLSGAGDFGVDASPESLLLDDDPDLRVMREVSQEYGSSDFLAITVRPDELSAEKVQQLRDLVTDLNQLSWARSVISIDDAIVYPKEKLSLADAVDNLQFVRDLPADQVEQVLGQLSENPFFSEQLISKDKGVMSVLVFMQGNDEYDRLTKERYRLQDKRKDEGLSLQETQRYEELIVEVGTINEAASSTSRERIAEIRALLANHKKIGDLRLVGGAMILVDVVESLERDLSVFGGAVLLLFLLMLTIMLRRVVWVLVPILCSGVVVAVVTGSLGFLGWKVTVLSSNFIALLMILTISLVVHIMIRHSEEKVQEDGTGKNGVAGAAARACQAMLMPCFLAALTTGVGFASLLISGIKPVEDFGKMMMLGISIAFVVSFTLAPALLGLAKNKQQSSSNSVGMTAVTDKLFVFIDQQWKAIFISAIALLAILGYGATQLEVDNKFLDYFKDSSEINRGMSEFDRELGGTVPMTILLQLHPDEVVVAKNSKKSQDEDWGEEEAWGEEESDDGWGADEFSDDDGYDQGVQAPNSLWLTSYGMDRLRSTAKKIEQVNGVGKVISIHTAVEMAEGLLQRDLNDFELSFLLSSLPDEISSILVDPYISTDRQTVHISLRIKETAADVKRSDMLAEIERLLIDEQWKAEEYKVTGLAVLYNNLLQSLYISQILTLGLVLGTILLLLVLVLRSIPMAVVAMIPTMLSSGVVLGSLGLSGKPLDIMTVTVAAISVGLAVDNAIHYLNRFKLEKLAGATTRKAIEVAHKTVAQGIITTNLSIMAGFLVFTLSDFIPTIFFGLLVSLAMGVGSLATLIVLPSGLVLLYGRDEDKTKQTS